MSIGRSAASDVSEANHRPPIFRQSHAPKWEMLIKRAATAFTGAATRRMQQH